jgi:hypothetical protein
MEQVTGLTMPLTLTVLMGLVEVLILVVVVVVAGSITDRRERKGREG